MSKRLGIIGMGSATLALTALVVTQTSDKVTLAQMLESSKEQQENGKLDTDYVLVKDVKEEKQIGSISLSPALYVPDQAEFLNQEVAWEDVQKTMNLGIVNQTVDDSLNQLDADIEENLGIEESKLNEVQKKMYAANVEYYKDAIKKAKETAIFESDILEVMQQFTEWASGYKALIEAAIAEEARLAELKEIVNVDNGSKKVEQTHHVSYEIPELGEEYLTYMPYTAITAKNTPHYKLQQLASTNSEGYRTYQDAICVALASSFGTKIGTLYDITFVDGKKLRAILSDNKSDKHTDKNKQYRDATGKYDGSSGNILEIVFDVEGYPDMNSVNRKINSDYPSKIASIVKVGVAGGFE